MDKTLTRHRLSNPFGQAAATDWEELERSMREYGYDTRHPILLYEGQILDGWHRYQAAIKSNVEAAFDTFEGTEEEARNLVYRENLARRQMTAKQKATVFLLMNAWSKPSEQLSIPEIQIRCGIKTLTIMAQLRRLVENNPDKAHEVARGEKKAETAILELGEEPADSREGTDATQAAGDIRPEAEEPQSTCLRCQVHGPIRRWSRWRPLCGRLELSGVSRPVGGSCRGCHPG